MRLLRLFYYLPLYFYSIFNKKKILSDIDAWYNTLLIDEPVGEINKIVQLLRLPEFRSLLYYRCKTSTINPIKHIYPSLSTLFIPYDQVIGDCLVIQHGYSTIFNCEKMGTGCQVWQGVTIGKAKSGCNEPRPIIGNNVKICCHAIVIGGIVIGDNVTIGAGTVVRHNIPSNCVVVGNPARIVKQNGIKCNILL